MAEIAFRIAVVAGLALYFLPTIVGRDKRNAGAIFTLNLLLGWTLVGWVVALVWAMTCGFRGMAITVPNYDRNIDRFQFGLLIVFTSEY